MNNDPKSYWQPDQQPDPFQQPQPLPAAQPPVAPTPPVVAPVQQAPTAPVAVAQPPVSSPQVAEQTLSVEQPLEEERIGPVDTPITWQAQEYVHLDRSGLWYVLFFLAVLAFIAIDVFILKSWTFSVLVVVMAVALIVYVRRPARVLTYALSGAQGLYIGERLYHLSDFRAFGLIRDGDHNSIMLIPRKRFSPGVSVFFPEEAGEQIVDILGQRLPMEELHLDLIDIVVRKLRL